MEREDRTFLLQVATAAIVVGESRWSASGMPARRFDRVSTRLEAACISGEFVPVTTVPPASSMARPAVDAVVALARFPARFRGVGRGWTTGGSRTPTPSPP